MKIDVIITSYNYENYIRETLDSLTAQTYKDFGVIIVDDGSKDNSLKIINEYTEKYPNFHLYTHPNNENKGLIKSLKLGISKSDADYIVFLESDDYLAPNYMEEKVNYIKEHPDCKILINDITLVGESGISDKKRFNNYSYYINKIRKYYTNKRYGKNDFKYFYYENDLATFSCVMIKADVLKELDFNSKIYAWTDWWLWRQVALIYPIHFIDKKLTYWRIHDKSYIDRIDNVYENCDANSKKFLNASNTLLYKKYKTKFLKKYIVIKMKEFKKSCMRFIFSIYNTDDRTHKVVELLGFKIKFKREKFLQTRMGVERERERE